MESNAVKIMDVDAIRSREKAATPGPWSCRSDDIPSGVNGSRGPAEPKDCRLLFNVPVKDEDAIFIAHARTDIPELLKLVAMLEEDCERLERERDEARAQRDGGLS